MRSLNPLVHNVVWPAVAGSILWAFIQTALDPWESASPSNIDITYIPRLAALLSVGIYLAEDWLRVEERNGLINKNYWMCDLLLAPTLAAFAISTEYYEKLDARLPQCALLFAFIIVIIGQLCGAWDDDGKESHLTARSCFAGINLVGLAVVAWSFSAPAVYSFWLTAAAPLAVVVLYFMLREKITRRWKDIAKS